MPVIIVQFHGLWGLYLGANKFELEAETLEELVAMVEDKFGPTLRQKIKERGAKLDGDIIKYSYIALNNTGIRQLKNDDLKSGDVLRIFPSISGG